MIYKIKINKIVLKKVFTMRPRIIVLRIHFSFDPGYVL